MTETPDFTTIKYGAWLAFWLDTYKRPILKQNSISTIEQMLRLHTPQWLKDMRVKDITIFDIDSALSEIPISRTYIYTRQVWHSAFVKACRLGITTQNPLDLCEKVKYTKRRSEALTLGEQRAFIERLEKSRLKYVMLFYLYTGVRRAECVNIKWEDILEEEKLIRIKGTKSENSYREIFLTEQVKAIIQGQLQQNKKDNKSNSEYIFPYSANYMSQAFKQLCGKHHLHELRHTFITRCCESGINVNVCQQLVGHSTPTLTLQVYTHVMDEFKRKEMSKFTLFPCMT